VHASSRIKRDGEQPLELTAPRKGKIPVRLDAKAFGLAAGMTAAVLFVLCALAVAIAPGPTTAFFAYLVHMDLSTLPVTLTVASFIGGLICWTVGTAVTFWLAATIYNRALAGGTTAQAARNQRPIAQRA
jgi:membrane protein YqaA with SNARE-associated domain